MLLILNMRGILNMAIVDGKKLSQDIREKLEPRIAALKARGIIPGLTVILVGDDPASHVYVNNKERAAQQLGMNGHVLRLSADTGEAQLLELVDKLNADATVHGMLIQLPLPDHINELNVLERVNPKKDVDGIHTLSMGNLVVGRKGFVSCTPKGIIKLIESTGERIEGKHAVIIGRSNIVGKPAALSLLAKNATVTICHSKTKALADITRTADILVAAVGKPNFVTADMVKPGAIVIDAGTSKVDGKLTGDVKFDEVAPLVSFITPVPGGVGPMTITMLMENTVEAAEIYG
ncbi:Bifunctional protein FolD protein [bioreactor metagenome]|uniref:Bifunctional protein FolD protein n=1 Tax=bioreactor metagenome TaxID=1076179 RepID=A0A645CVX5_9ZZZZ